MEHKIIEEKIIFSGHKDKDIIRSKLQLPDGKIVEWDVYGGYNIVFAATVKDGFAYMTKEWRLGPCTYLTQFTGARFPFNQKENLSELQREVKEELGIVGGKYTKLISYAKGTHMRGNDVYYLVTDFEITDKTNRDPDEYQEMIKLPIKGLFNELKNNNVTTTGTLLVAKLLEEML